MEEYISDNSLYVRSKNNSMINRKMTGRVLGISLFVELGMFLLCARVSAGYGENDYKYFLCTCIINAMVGGLLLLCGRGAENRMSRRSGCCVVAPSWMFFIFFGMPPFYLSGSIDTITNTFFETTSGFITTGATILGDIESLSHDMLFWRSLTQRIGGLGTAFSAIAILPISATGEVRPSSAESTGMTHDRTHPKANVMAKWSWAIYLALTVLETVLLTLGGTSLLDATCQLFATTVTDEYSTKRNSVSCWNFPYIEYVVAALIIVSSINFSLFLMCLKGKVGRLLENGELHQFLASVDILTFFITLTLVFQNHHDWELTLRKALFRMSTVHTSCGFVTDDYNIWPPFTRLLSFITVLLGGCTGSISGGVKNMWLLIAVYTIRNESKYLLRPNAVLPVCINKQTMSSSIVTTVLIFFAFYLVLILIGWTALLFLRIGLSESVSTVISSIGNVGPGLGTCGPAHSWNSLPDLAKWIFFFLALVERLELPSVLLLFYSGLWKNR